MANPPERQGFNMKQDYISAKDWAKDNTPSQVPDRASKYIRRFFRLAKRRRGIRVVLFVRVSGWVQKWNQNLDAQESRLRRRVERLGGIVVDVFREVASGWRTNEWERGVLMA